MEVGCWHLYHLLGAMIIDQGHLYNLIISPWAIYLRLTLFNFFFVHVVLVTHKSTTETNLLCSDGWFDPRLRCPDYCGHLCLLVQHTCSFLPGLEKTFYLAILPKKQWINIADINIKIPYLYLELKGTIFPFWYMEQNPIIHYYPNIWNHIMYISNW